MRLVYIIFILTLISGCSSQQAYNTGQAYQRNECNKINDNAERGSCMDAANKTFEEYNRQKEAK
jgi:uncharacterized protein YceK